MRSTNWIEKAKTKPSQRLWLKGSGEKISSTEARKENSFCCQMAEYTVPSVALREYTWAKPQVVKGSEGDLYSAALFLN